MRLDFSVGNFNQEQTHTQDPLDLQSSSLIVSSRLRFKMKFCIFAEDRSIAF